MMAQRFLWLLNIGLALALAWLWVDETGQPRPQVWAAPAALAPGATAAAAAPTAAVPGNPAQYMAILDRPLFAPDRRPPPPPEPPAPPPPPDPFATLVLYGLFGSGDTGGLLANIDGRLRRVRLGERVGEWVFKSIQGRSVVFANGDTERSLTLVPQLGARKPPAANNLAPPSGVPGFPPDRQAQMQADQEAARERLRRRNEILQKAGLPLATD